MTVIHSSPSENIPCLDEVPVGQVLRLVIGIGRAGPVDQVKVDIVQTEVLKRRFNALVDTVVPGVVELGGNPDLLTRNTGVTDTLTNLGLVAVCQSTITLSIHVPGYRRLSRYMCNSRVDVAVAPQQSVLDGLADLIGLGLPGTQTNGRDFGARVEGVGLPIRDECLLVFFLFLA